MAFFFFRTLLSELFSLVSLRDQIVAELCAWAASIELAFCSHG